MADNGFTISADPVELLGKFVKDLEPIEEDFFYAGNRQKSRILGRTERGVDVNEQPFAAYSTKGPYYWYPDRNLKNRGAARNRFFKTTAGQYGHIHAGVAKTRTGVKFPSYAAFKAELGRAFVDLTGPRAPHMLQAIVVIFRAGLLVIGIYGDEGKRASGHNTGTKTLPRRHFFGASASDKTAMAKDLLYRAKQRLKAGIFHFAS